MKLIYVLLGFLAISSMALSKSPRLSVDGKMKLLNLAAVNQPRSLQAEECHEEVVTQVVKPNEVHKLKNVDQECIETVHEECVPQKA